MKDFRELSRRSRLYRLRELARAALNVYGLKNTKLSFMQYFQNIIYRVDMSGPTKFISDNSPYIPNRYLLRIHAMGDIEAIASELTWLAALNTEAGLPVPAPIPTPDGRLMANVSTQGIPTGRVVSLMKWLDGRRYLQRLQPKQMTALEKVVADLHTFSTGWQPPAGFSRPHWNWDSQLGGSLFRHSVEELVDSMSLRAKVPFQVISREAKMVMDAFGKGIEAYGLIHADLYPENVLFKSGMAFPIDFEDCGFGYWIWDIAIALWKWAWGDEWERLRDAFYKGYSQSRTLSNVQWEKLDLFVAIHSATMVLWVSDFIQNDPQRVAEYEPLREENLNKLLSYFER
jgi:Ser/Thr protein kinase RdoA (MazF antagonist)